MKGCKFCEMLDYQQQQQQKLLLKSGSLSNSASKLHAKNSSNSPANNHLLNYCNHLASIRRSSTGSSGSACESNGSPSMSSASSSSSLLSVPSPTTSLPSPVATSATSSAPPTGSLLSSSSPSSSSSQSLGTAPSLSSKTNNISTSNSSSLAGKIEQSYHAILPQHFRDMFYASHLFRGYYQPAGPLISQHLLPPTQGNNSSLVVSTKQVSSPNDPERDHQIPQISHHSSSIADSPDNDVLITGGDLTTFRYPSQQTQPGQQPQSQALSTLAPSQPPPPQQSSPYSRQLHPMHYPPYPPSYYSPYPGDAMCYPPPYQHYFPAKVYQTAPTYRRYSSYYQPGPPPSELYDPPPPSNAVQAQPPQPGSQLVPTGPSGPQHIEHYTGPPGYYTSFNPGGGECYPPRGMQPSYMEYPAPCPCPMQSCPKNVLTGPLIGSNSNSTGSGSNLNGNSTNNSNSACNITSNSTNINSITNANSVNASNNNSSLSNLNQQLKTNKGPVRMHNNHLIGQHEQSTQPPNSNLSNGQPILTKPVHHRHHHLQCKMELLETLKSEIKSDVISESVPPTETRKTGQYEETVVPPTPPSTYTVNDKLTEPEATLSPARGSTGPQTLPEKSSGEATQEKRIEPAGQTRLSQPPNPSECDNNTNLIPAIGRKARIGKSMAREMMYGAHAINLPQHPPAFSDHNHKSQQSNQHVPSQNPGLEANKLPVLQHSNVAIGPDVIDRIKKEEIKLEEEDDVVILEDEVKQVKAEPEIVEVPDKSSDVDEVGESCKIDDDISILLPPAKRIKILDSKSSCKKSTFNGYKSFIKQTEPKSYLCLSSAKRDKKNYFRKYSKLIGRHGIRKRKLVLTEQQKKRLSIRKRNLIAMEKCRLQKKQESMIMMRAPSGRVSSNRREESKSKQSDVSNALGFQHQDLPSDFANDTRGYFSEPDVRAASSRKTKKTRSNETRSKSETKKSKAQKKVANTTIQNLEKTSSEMMPKLPANMINSTKVVNSQNGKCEIESRTSKNTKNSKKKSKSQRSTPVTELQYECGNQSVIDYHPQPHTSSTFAAEMAVDRRVGGEECLNEQNNNNNNINIEDTDFSDYMPAMVQTNCRSSSSGKRSRARGYRFSRKRPKSRRYQTEVDDSIIPRKTNAVPKWNNGWSWLGESFQAKVFLNSDDPLVIRTCYPAMRHIEGDIIRPRDCVLLKAGNKKNELPYVAKVAHLWENPEDGEMMMSLLWYYRPEHTEQGRQPNDCSDEVFASRHRDHNSVACIEDKCYVLTFSEYCRYRRRVRAAEEGIDVENRIVPLLKISNMYTRKVPVSTNPEQVMFCQRVYEFRLKRLLKTPTN